MSPEHENQNPQPFVAEAPEAEAPAAVSAEALEETPLPATAERAAAESADEPEPVPTAEAQTEVTAEAAETSVEALDALIDQYSAPHQAPIEGEIIEGHVVAITDLGVVVDIGDKTEALIPAQELLDADAGPAPMPGQTIEVQRLDERKEGYQLLSYLRARRRRAWEKIEQSHRGRIPLTGRVVDRIKGGLVVDVGVRAFLPASQVDIRPV